MGDAFSNAIKAQREAEPYLEGKGWIKVELQGRGFTTWRDPLPPHEEHFFDVAWDIQYVRDQAAAGKSGG